jgi:hypothetical protein
MPNKIRTGADRARIKKRHGRAGNVVLRCDVPPDLFDAVAKLAQRHDLPLRAVVEQALRRAVGWP